MANTLAYFDTELITARLDCKYLTRSAVTENNKHASLLQYRINYDRAPL